MRIFGRLLVLALIGGVAACGVGEIAGSAAEQGALYCYGNPDSPTGVVCVPEQDVWDCETMPNGEVKCLHTPDGAGGWSCTEVDGRVVCTSGNPDAAGGGGWDCTHDDSGTTCTSVGGSGGGDDGSAPPFTPPGGGSWDCTVTELGVVCVGSDDGGGNGGGGGDDGGDDGDGKPKPGDFRTQTPGGWGAPAAGNNPGAYRDAHFADAFPEGLRIGCVAGKSALFTSAKAVEVFLPAGGTPSALDHDYIDPVATSGGVLAGHTVALTLAVTFDRADADFSGAEMHLEHLVAAKGSCAGMTVAQILATANAVLGRCGNPHLSPSEITGCVDAVNQNFVDGVKAGGYLRYP